MGLLDARGVSLHVDRDEADRHHALRGGPGNELATLYFGHNDQYVLTLSRENLGKFVDLANSARGELDAT
jgi:hypothetical protein